MPPPPLPWLLFKLPQIIDRPALTLYLLFWLHDFLRSRHEHYDTYYPKKHTFSTTARLGLSAWTTALFC
jgi:hypothetical protein